MAPEPFNRLVRATVVSLIGLREAYRSEPAFRQELLVLLLLIPTARLLTSTGMERALLIGSWMLVIVVGTLNSAIEAAVDRVGNEHHELSKKAKDFASAAGILLDCDFDYRLDFGFVSPGSVAPKG